MKCFFALILFSLQFTLGISQKVDSSTLNKPVPISAEKVIAISTDGMQYILDQPNICIEYMWNRFSIGVYAGIIIPDANFEVNPFANGQYTNPGTVYSGAAFKLYFKCYDVKKTNHYWAIQLECKPEYFNNTDFYDEPVHDEVLVSYTMNEKATVLGIDLLRGYELRKPNILHLDFFYGFGLHLKNRDYTVSSSNTTGGMGGQKYMPTDGIYQTVAADFTPVVGLKLGLNYIIKK